MASQQKMCALCGTLNGSLPYHYHSKHNYCDPCKETFPDRGSIILHLMQRHNKKLKCPFCNIQTLTEAILEQHIIRKHQSTTTSQSLKKFQCHLCPFVAKYKNILVKHVETKHAAGSALPTYRCHLCRYVTREKEGLAKHLKLEHKSFQLPPNMVLNTCDYDDDYDDDEDDDDDEDEVIENHKEYITDQKQVIQNYVMAKEGSVPEATPQIKSDSPPPSKKAKTEVATLAINPEERPSPSDVCMICQEELEDEIHYSIEHQECSQCHKVFVSANEIIEHYAIVHLKTTLYQCNVCDYYGFSMNGVEEHRDQCHASPIKYMCGDCKAGFDNEQGLLQHLVNHKH